jgi:hypothetical protein
LVRVVDYQQPLGIVVLDADSHADKSHDDTYVRSCRYDVRKSPGM